jgi:tRNA threonylcarbamoyladenosine biosynthesis protein TsaE
MNASRSIRIRTASSDETFDLGCRLGMAVEGGTVIALTGDLGTGKTTFAQGIAQGMGVDVPVTSPTFTLVNEYSTPAGLILVHIDSYRLGETCAEALLEAETFGLDELLDAVDVVIVIEWAERVAALLPVDHLSVMFRYQPNQPDVRQIECSVYGPLGEQILLAMLGNDGQSTL